jgi:gluconate 2-dehydrogenase gamma chain
MAEAGSPGTSRRNLLAGVAVATLLAACSDARSPADSEPARYGAPPRAVRPGPWQFFTPEEATAVEALVDRLIPPDPQWPGGKDAGCAVFIDRQLAGPYGESRGLYMRPPFQDGDPQQGPQSPLPPAMRYRRSLASLDQHCRATLAGTIFARLSNDQQDALIAGLENGQVMLEGVSGRGFFDLLLQNTQEGFFADPLYGGNRDMAAWKMIGFPGARYDYRDG